MLQVVRAVVLGCAGALLLGTPVGAIAQQIDPSRIIDFHVNLEEFNQSVGGAVKEGGRYTMTINGRGAYVLTAVVTDAAAKKVSITVHRASSDKSEDYRPVETVRATVGTPVPLKSIPQASVVVEGIRKSRVSGGATGRLDSFASTLPRTASASQLWEPVRSTALFGSCCVTCGNVTACGCAVSSDCGSCCSDDCCKVSLPIRETSSEAPRTPAQTFYRFTGSDCRRPVADDERLYTGPEGLRQVALRGN